MKTAYLTLALLFTVILTAQDIKPKFEIQGDLVKATYFHDNGTVAQTGYFLDKKVHGEWEAYNVDGKKTAMATYNKGEKVGKWTFWKGKEVNEVMYTDSRIASVTTLNKRDSLVNN